MSQSLRTLRMVLLVLLVCLVPLGLAYVTGGTPPATVWLDAPGWSRARTVGTTQLDEAVPIAIDQAGNSYLFLVQTEQAGRRAQIIALDPGANLRWERSLEPESGDLSSPQLHWDGQNLMLFWLNTGQLRSARFDGQGNALAAASSLSGATRVATFATALDSKGQLALWFAGTAATPGIYAITPGPGPASAQRVAPGGSQPSLGFDQAGTLHATWLGEAEGDSAPIMYTTDPGGPPQALAQINSPGNSSTLDGPWFGLEASHGYLIWTTRITTGMNAGRSFSQYIAFPLDQPAMLSPVTPIQVPGTANLAYEDAATYSLLAGPRMALATDGAQQGAPPAALRLMPTGAGELAVAVQTTGSAGQSLGQVGALFLQAGRATSYQRLSQSERSAFSPLLASDHSQHLYLTWRELRANGYAVYLASTAPALREALAPLSFDDGLRLVSAVLFGMLTGVIFAPFTALLWLGPALLVLLPLGLLSRAKGQVAPWISMASVSVALAMYWYCKMRFVGGMLATVPFAAWLPIVPPWLEQPLQFGVPVLIALLALGIAWRITAGRGRPSALFFVLVYGAVDCICTMAVYGEQLFAR